MQQRTLREPRTETHTALATVLAAGNAPSPVDNATEHAPLKVEGEADCGLEAKDQPLPLDEAEQQPGSPRAPPIRDHFISLPKVQEVAGGKSRATIWRWVRAGLFPKPRRIGPNSIGWLASEINAWVEAHKTAA